MRQLKDQKLKTKLSPQVLLGLGAVAVVLVVGSLIYFLRASDPASRGPIAFKKFDYGAHMQQTHQFNQHAPVAAGSPGSNSAATP